VRSLLAAADLAQNRGRLLDARRHLLDAVERQPYSVTAWRRLLNLTLDMADRPGARAAARRLLELDPIGRGTLALTGRLVLFSVPASGSPTATGTPLTPAYTTGTVPLTPVPGGPAAGTPQTPDGSGAITPGPGTPTPPPAAPPPVAPPPVAPPPVAPGTSGTAD